MHNLMEAVSKQARTYYWYFLIFEILYYILQYRYRDVIFQYLIKVH